MLYLDAALLALVVVRESRSFLSTQVQAVVSSCRSTNRSQPRIIAPAVAAFDAIVRRRRRKSRLNAAAIFSCLLLFFPRTLSAQANASGLSMSVKDPQGLPIVDAKVDIMQSGAQRLAASLDGEGLLNLRLVPGTYRITVSAPGFASKEQLFEIGANCTTQVSVQLQPTASETVTVQAGDDSISPETTSPRSTLSPVEATALPSRPQTALDALPLVPGVIRAPDGPLQIGGRDETHSSLLIDGIDTSDPDTGAFTLGVPINAAETIHVSVPAYGSQYGRFSAGAVEIQTRKGPDRWHFDVDDPFPEFRIRSGHVRGVKSMSPRVTFGGPVFDGRVKLLESFGFVVDKAAVRTLYFPNNEIKTRSENSFTRADVALPKQQSLSLSLHLAKTNTDFAGLSYFTPQTVTTNDRMDSVVLTVALRKVWTQTMLDSSVSVGGFLARSAPHGSAEMVVSPTGTSGNFYKNSAHDASRFEWNEGILWTPPAHPAHQLTMGLSTALVDASGQTEERPLRLLDVSGTTIETISFQGGSSFKLRDIQPALYFQDHWATRPHLVLDLGVRMEGQSLTATSHISPRFAFAWSPSANTVVRGGAGTFFESVPLQTYGLGSLPNQTVTLYANGNPGASRAYAFQEGAANANSDQPLVNRFARTGNFAPVTYSTSLEVEHGFNSALTLRVRMLHNESRNQLILLPSASTSAYQLSDGGRWSTTQFEVSGRMELQKSVPLNFSYVHSSAKGTLNSPENVLSASSLPFVRNEANGAGTSDLPHRLLLWGETKLPSHIVVNPVLEVRSGFPYQSLDVYQNFVANEAASTHRLPLYASVDLRVSRPFRLTDKYTLLPSISATNVTNHFNSLAVHNNTADPLYGTAFGNNDRHLRFDLDVKF